jgi:hypothetical protein
MFMLRFTFKAKPWVETHWEIIDMELGHDIVQDTGTSRRHSRATGGLRFEA